MGTGRSSRRSPTRRATGRCRSRSETSTGDGAADLATANFFSDDVSVLLQALPAVSLAPVSHDFGEVLVGAGPSPAQVFTVANSGDADLTVAAVALVGADAGEFVITADGCSGVVVGAGASCQLAVVFDPSSTGSKNASLQVSDNAPGSPQTATLTGVGVAEAPVPVVDSITPAFGPVGTLVTILGERFADATGVLFGEVEARFRVVSDAARVRVHVTKPGLVNRVSVRFTIPGRSTGAKVVTRPVRGRTRLTVPVTFSTLDLRGPSCGRKIVARLDPGDRLTERRERNNTISARIRGHA